MLHLHLAFPALLSALTLCAQVPTDGWAIGTISTSTGKLCWITADLQNLVIPSPQTAGMANTNAIAVDDAGMVYYGTTTTSMLYRVLLSGSTVVQETQLAGPLGTTSASVSAVALRGDQLWYVLSNGTIGYVDRTTANQSPTAVYNFKTANGVIGSGNAMCTDGREMFVGTTSTADPYNVWALDVSGPTPSWRGVALVAVPGSVSNSMSQLSLGRDGKIVACTVGGFFVEIDPETGVFTPLNASVSPQGRLNAGSINPWTGMLGGGTGATSNPMQVDFFDPVSNTWLPNLHSFSPDVPAMVVAACSPPFEKLGRGCPGSSGVDARIGASGLPVHGSSFQLSVRDGEPFGVAMQWLGLSSRNWLALPLPFDLLPFGAPGCELLTSIDLLTAVPLTNGAATVTYALPNLPALNGLVLHAQWASTANNNSLGLATSDALRIRCR